MSTTHKDPSRVKLVAASSKYSYEDGDGVTAFKFVIKTAEGERVGHLEGFKIDRDAIEYVSDFHLALEPACQVSH